MAIYAIGDIQGCFTSLQRLVDLINFDPIRDRLWFVGDLVNRGPQSLAVLRYIKNLGESAVTVLGNHDLHLLAIYAGVAQQRPKDTVTDILEASDCEELLLWLRHRSMMHREGPFVLIHAGLLPQWSISQAHELAKDVESVLRSDHFSDFLRETYRCETSSWLEHVPPEEMRGVITNIFTRMRICTEHGRFNLAFNGSPSNIPAGFFPWYDVPTQAPRQETILFGHWSALGLKIQNNIIALDGGCVWGRKLLAVRLEDRKVFQVPCPNAVVT